MTTHAPRCECCAELARLRAGLARAARASSATRRAPCATCGSTAERNRRRMEGGVWVWYCAEHEPAKRTRGRPG